MPEEFFDCVLRAPVVIELCNKSSAKLLNIDLHLLIQQLHGEVVLRRFRRCRTEMRSCGIKSFLHVCTDTG